MTGPHIKCIFFSLLLIAEVDFYLWNTEEKEEAEVDKLLIAHTDKGEKVVENASAKVGVGVENASANGVSLPESASTFAALVFLTAVIGASSADGVTEDTTNRAAQSEKAKQHPKTRKHWSPQGDKKRHCEAFLLAAPGNNSDQQAISLIASEVHSYQPSLKVFCPSASGNHSDHQAFFPATSGNHSDKSHSDLKAFSPAASGDHSESVCFLNQGNEFQVPMPVFRPCGHNVGRPSRPHLQREVLA